MAGPFLFLVILFVIPLIVYATSLRNRNMNESWKAAAAQLSLAFTPGGFSSRRNIMGDIRGNMVLVETYSEGSGKTSTRYTRYTVTYPTSLNVGLQLTRQGFMSQVAGWFGSQDIEIGSAGFDDDVVVKGSDPRVVIEFMTPARRLRAHRLMQTFDRCEISDNAVTISYRGAETSAEKIVSTVGRVLAVAEEFSGTSDRNHHLDRAMEAQRAGNLDEALELVREVESPDEAAAADVRMLEGNILYTHGRFDDAAVAFERARDAVPDDEEAGAWAERAASRGHATPTVPMVEPDAPTLPDDEPDAPTVPAVESAAPTVPAVEPDASPSSHSASDTALETVCETLFGTDRMSHEIKQIFEDRFDGKPIRWQGKLDRVSTYAFDGLFGFDPGTKAVFEVYEAEESPYGGRTVQAVVQFPADAIDVLRPRTGEQMTFEGTLLSCDAFMRNLFVANARVVD